MKKESQDPDNKIEQEKGNTNLLEEQSGTNTNTYLNQEEQKSPEIENVVSDFHDNMPSDKISKGDNYFTESPARFTGNNSKSPVQTEKEMKEIIEDNHILEENLKNEDKELELKKEVSARKIQKCFRKKKAKMFKKGKKHGKLLKALYKSKEHTQFVFSINGDISSKTIVLKFYDIQTKKVHEKHEINLDNEVLDKTIISESWRKTIEKSQGNIKDDCQLFEQILKNGGNEVIPQKVEPAKEGKDYVCFELNDEIKIEQDLVVHPVLDSNKEAIQTQEIKNEQVLIPQQKKKIRYIPQKITQRIHLS